MLHILNGDAVKDTFIKSDIGKKYAVWRELYCQGPTLLNIYEQNSVELRKSFFKSFFNIPSDEYSVSWQSQLEIIKTDALHQVVLWFEYDLFCQFNMMAAIYFINQTNEDAQIYLVNVGKSLRQSEWITLGHLDSKDWATLYGQKKLLSPAEKQWICGAWEIYCSAFHKRFDKIVDYCPSVFKYFPQAIENHYRRFHSTADELTDIQRFIKEILQQENGIPRPTLLRRLIKHFHYYGYGDLQYQSMLEALFFVQLENNRYFLDWSEGLTSEELRTKLPDMQYGGMSNKAVYLEEFIEL